MGGEPYGLYASNSDALSRHRSLYELILLGDGMLVLNRVSGLWKKEVLGKQDNVAGAGPGEWVCMGISIQGNRIATAFDGRPFFEEEDGDPLPGGYPGFCVPRHVKKFNFKEVSL